MIQSKSPPTLLPHGVRQGLRRQTSPSTHGNPCIVNPAGKSFTRCSGVARRITQLLVRLIWLGLVPDEVETTQYRRSGESQGSRGIRLEICGAPGSHEWYVWCVSSTGLQAACLPPGPPSSGLVSQCPLMSSYILHR